MLFDSRLIRLNPSYFKDALTVIYRDKWVVPVHSFATPFHLLLILLTNRRTHRHAAIHFYMGIDNEQ